MKKSILKRNYPVCTGEITRQPTLTEINGQEVRVNKASKNSGTVTIKHKNDIKNLEVYLDHFNLAKGIEEPVSELKCDYDNPSRTRISVYYQGMSLYKIAKRGKIRIFGRKKEDVLYDIKTSREYAEICMDLQWDYNHKVASLCDEHNNAVEKDARQKVHVKTFDPRDNPWYF